MPAHRLNHVDLGSQGPLGGRTESNGFVGRESEMSAGWAGFSTRRWTGAAEWHASSVRRASARADSSARAASAANDRGVDVYWAFCESHAGDVPFHFVIRLLRSAFAFTELDDQAAGLQLRARSPDADPPDLLLLDDLVGIADPEVAPPKIDPDARRRRFTALVKRDVGPHSTHALHRRGRPLDRRRQRVDARRLLGRHPAVPVDGAGHLSPRISGRVEPDARGPDHLACATQ